MWTSSQTSSAIKQLLDPGFQRTDTCTAVSSDFQSCKILILSSRVGDSRAQVSLKENSIFFCYINKCLRALIKLDLHTCDKLFTFWVNCINKINGKFTLAKKPRSHQRGSYRGGSLAWFTNLKIEDHGSRTIKFRFPES